MNRSIAFLAGASLAVAACSDDPPTEQAPDDDRTAEGEVSGGTISDAMLPLDSVRSQSPPLRPEGASGGELNDAQGSEEADESVAPASEDAGEGDTDAGADEAG